jgi:hypothetical protein
MPESILDQADSLMRADPASEFDCHFEGHANGVDMRLRRGQDGTFKCLEIAIIHPQAIFFGNELGARAATLMFRLLRSILGLPADASNPLYWILMASRYRGGTTLIALM